MRFYQYTNPEKMFNRIESNKQYDIPPFLSNTNPCYFAFTSCRDRAHVSAINDKEAYIFVVESIQTEIRSVMIRCLKTAIHMLSGGHSDP